jgi:hypothetical protein
MAITTKATSNFSFRKLANAFDEVFDGYMEDSYDDLAQSARDTITSGKGLKPLSAGTKALRKRGFYSRGKKIAPTSETRPLLHTGKLLRSIKATKEGVSMVGYAKYHLEEHEIIENDWTKRYTPNIKFLIVPPRNPFFNAKGDVKPGFKKGADRRMQELIKKINKVWRV